MAASQIEKSTLDASKFGFTQKRDYKIETPVAETSSPVPVVVDGPQCRIDDPDCEACQ